MTATLTTNRPNPPTTSPLVATRTAGPRMAWLDVARAGVVVTVVVMHVTEFWLTPLVSTSDSPALGFWSAVDGVLLYVRMPTLMLVSGWLASSRVRAGWGSTRLRRTVVTNAYLYAVWLAAYALFSLAIGPGHPNDVTSVTDALTQLVLPNTSLWFLAGLVWCVAVTAALRRVPAPVVVGGFLVMSYLSEAYLPGDWGTWTSLPHYAVFFVLGVYGRDGWARLAADRRVSGLALLAGAALHTSHTPDVAVVSFAMGLTERVCAVVVVLAAAIELARAWPRLVDPLARLGRQTLPVYVLHFPLLLALLLLGGGEHGLLASALVAEPALAWLFPVLASATLVLLSVGLAAAAQGAGLSWLFALPRRTTWVLVRDRGVPARGLA